MTMKNILFVTATLLFLSSSIYAQSSLPVGRTQLNFGVGLSSWGIPVYLGLDHSIHENLTLGGEFSYRSYNEKWEKNRYNHSVTGFSGNLNYHLNNALNISQNWDFYAGINLGFYSWSSPDKYEGSHNSGLGLGGQVGGRYFLSDKVGLNLEFGGGNAFSGGKLGLTVKL